MQSEGQNIIRITAGIKVKDLRRLYGRKTQLLDYDGIKVKERVKVIKMKADIRMNKIMRLIKTLRIIDLSDHESNSVGKDAIIK